MATEYVYLTRSSRSNQVFHTDESCRFLPDSPTKRQRTPLEEIGYDECSECAQEARGHDVSPDRSVYSAALQAGGSDD